MAVKVPQNEEIYGGGKNRGKKKSVLLSVEEANRVSINIKQ